MELSELRKMIDETDRGLTELFLRRMELCARIAGYKADASLPVLDAGREREKLEQVCAMSPEPMRGYTGELYSLLLEQSRRYQQSILDGKGELP